ncbi:MAG: glycosyltransferase [Alphaproteobacteria bacterium]|nr:MAG: glycosyltransferase [Alphaproteobacteria bacterium]
MAEASSKIRVMHMIGAPRPGGAEMFAYRLLVALNKHKDVDLLAVTRKGSWLDGMLRDAGIRVESVGFGGLLDLKSRRQVGKIAREFMPHVVQSWMNRATRFVPKGPWAKVGRLGGFYDLKYYWNRVDHLIGNTQAICDYCVARGWDAGRVSMISNFIPLPAKGWQAQGDAVRKKLRIKRNAVVLMMAGRLHKVKGVDVAFEALQHLPENFVLMLVGEGPLRQDLQALARKLGIADRVYWAGWQDSVTPYAAAADIWLAPSRHEPLGNTALDGWVHEIPVIASRTGGLEMLIDNEDSGLLIDVGDGSGLADAILRVAENDALAKKLVAGGMRSFLRDYGEDGIVKKYVKYYKDMAEEGTV